MRALTGTPAASPAVGVLGAGLCGCRLYLHNNALTGPIPPQLADMANLTTLWLAANNLTGTIPAALGATNALTVLDARDNPLTWPPPPTLAQPPAGLTALLPDTHSWVPPRPDTVVAQPGDGTLEIAWEHPGTETDFVVDAYTINYRPQNTTGAFTQHTATAPPAVISGLTNGTTPLTRPCSPWLRTRPA